MAGDKKVRANHFKSMPGDYGSGDWVADLMSGTFRAGREAAEEHCPEMTPPDDPRGPSIFAGLFADYELRMTRRYMDIVGLRVPPPGQPAEPPEEREPAESWRDRPPLL